MREFRKPQPPVSAIASASEQRRAYARARRSWQCQSPEDKLHSYEETRPADELPPATGATFRDHIALSFVVEGDMGTASGIGFNLVRQGQGAVLQLIGRRVEDANGNLLFVIGGPNDIEGGLEAAICAALA